jgi:hypothetical protein
MTATDPTWSRRPLSGKIGQRSTHFDMKMTPEMRDQLQAAAAREGTTASALVRRLVAAHLAATA